MSQIRPSNPLTSEDMNINSDRNLVPSTNPTSVVSELTPEMSKIYKESLGIKVYELESKIEL